MFKTVKTLFIVSLFAGALLASGCSSSPSAEELRELDRLKAEVASLQNQLDAKRMEKAALEKEIAEASSKLTECQSDQEAVKAALGQ